jgi:hypothetical protein
VLKLVNDHVLKPKESSSQAAEERKQGDCADSKEAFGGCKVGVQDFFTLHYLTDVLPYMV